MPYRPLRRGVAALAVAAFLAGCPGGPAVGPPKPTAKPTSRPPVEVRAVPADALAKATAGLATRAIAGGIATTLSGQVKVIANNGGGIISDNGAGVISNNSGTILSNNGSAAVASNGQRYAVLQDRPGEVLLADAVVTVHDAQGHVLLGADGKPIAAYTDRQGRYALDAKLPAENVVLTIRLWNGGTLSAMRAKDGGAEQPLDTATSLGAAYVLTTYVKGDQAIFDKLPAAEADGLRQALAAAQGGLAGVPSYTQADLVARAGGLRDAVAAVDARLDAIAALLIGQANAGNGRPATEVAIARPRAMAVDARGHLFFGDATLGRVREIDAAGRIGTFADVVLGSKVKRNFFDLTAMAAAPDGSLWIAGDNLVYAVRPDGRLDTLTASGPNSPRPLDLPAGEARLRPRGLAIGPDGTAWVRDADGDAAAGRGDRLVTLRDGRAAEVPIPAELAGPWTMGLGLDAAGNLYVMAPRTLTEPRVLKRTPAGAWSVHATWTRASQTPEPGVAVAPDGTVYASEGPERRVMRVAPDGQVGVAAGAGGPAATAGLDQPGAIAVGPDGTLYVDDGGSGRIFALTQDGAFTPYAGASGVVERRGDLASVAINGPVDVVAEGDGTFVFTEGAGFAAKRFDGTAVTTVAGVARGAAGDGGPAAAARMDGPTGIARHGGATWVLDAGGGRIRKIAADGTITTVAGGGATKQELAAGKPIPAAQVDLFDAQGLAIDAQGRPYFAKTIRGQIGRVEADGTVTLVAGRGVPEDGLAQALAAQVLEGGASWPAAEAPLLTPIDMAFDEQGDLFVAEALALRIMRISGLDGAAPRATRWAGVPSAEAIARATTGNPVDLAAELSKPLLETILGGPTGLAFDAAGALYVSLSGSKPVAALPPSVAATAAASLPPIPPLVIRIAPDGTIRRVAGEGAPYYGDPHAEDALVLPGGLAVDGRGNLAICDTGANLLRVLPPAATAP